jgi:hypothetical protein
MTQFVAAEKKNTLSQVPFLCVFFAILHAPVSDGSYGSYMLYAATQLAGGVDGWTRFISKGDSLDPVLITTTTCTQVPTQKCSKKEKTEERVDKPLGAPRQGGLCIIHF